MQLFTVFGWNDDPSSLAEIGYQVLVDVGWPDRHQRCFDLPAQFRVTVDGKEAMDIGSGGDCQWDFLFRVGGFWENAPVTVRVLDGERLLGEAIYKNAFPGLKSQLLVPADSRVQAGGDVTATLPEGFKTPFSQSARFYWRDTPDSVPPFYTFASAAFDPETLILTAKAPSVSGL